ncbi:hypothetical protein BVI434_3190015 [Burkholderia vietnamiensis]|nr:hypothetical protein BVI1335_1310004 [Burkholderia vietnamiensis]CAG9216584.1 hypothetical protein BVI434_3190015 [Burkholderia vietnamiensis]
MPLARPARGDRDREAQESAGKNRGHFPSDVAASSKPNVPIRGGRVCSQASVTPAL